MSDSDPQQHDSSPRDEEGDEHDVAPSNLLIRSFVVLIGSVIVYFVLGLGTHAAVILIAFPDEAKAMSKPRENETSDEKQAKTGSNEEQTSDDTNAPQTDQNQNDEEAEKPNALTPSPLFWGAGILIYLVAAFASGCLIGKLAPMAAMGHGVFLAAILFLSSLQAKDLDVFDRPPWALAAYAFGVPLTVMIGTWCMLPRELSEESLREEAESD